jgi:hypothetical protein
MTLSEQARADAIADAETLRAYLTVDLGEIHPDSGANMAGHYVFEAGWAGGQSLADSLPVEYVPGWARLAAHEAFRAVPGLR